MPPATQTKNPVVVAGSDDMMRFPLFFSKPPSLKELPLKRYLLDFALNRLVFGVDCIRIDVHITPRVHPLLARAVSASMVRHSRAEIFFEDDKKNRHENEKIALRQVCKEVLLEGINRAKAESEVQIDFLGQAALAKMFLEEIHDEYRKLMANLETLIRTFELSRNYDPYEFLKMKAKLTEIKQNRKRIIRGVGEEMFGLLADVNARDLKNVRESIFPSEHILPDTFFINPALHEDNVADDFLLMDAYVLFDQRSDEPDNDHRLQSIIGALLNRTDLEREGAAGSEIETGEADIPSTALAAFHPWLMEIGNIDLMFNCFDSREQYQKARQRKESKSVLLEWRSRIRIQEKLLNLFYRQFKRSGLLELIVAAYEMKPLYRDYCPPLRPLQVREYLISRGSRRALARELRRRESFNGTRLSLAPLQETIRRIRYSFGRKKREHLLHFLKDFLRYHRDLENVRRLKQAMDAINLLKDEKALLLSKQNGLLHEFLLPEERAKEEQPVVGHVILKADIRGSMDITHTMRARGLSPAPYFSLNFFDPISEILCDYNASKVFIEGDAVILSIFEKKDTAQNGYSVARACGLAVSILQIVRQYNVKNQKHDLPILELGIGICYNQSPPAYLFDGNSRIMISPAINLADRLSGCDKRLHKRIRNQDRMFNLYVFKSARDEEVGATADDLSLRYNVNGIELDPVGFAKLSGEINLKRIEYLTKRDEKAILYTGKVPTVSGKYQRLVIREAALLEVNPDTLDAIGLTERKYYEVCTQPAVYEFIDRHA